MQLFSQTISEFNNINILSFHKMLIFSLNRAVMDSEFMGTIFKEAFGKILKEAGSFDRTKFSTNRRLFATCTIPFSLKMKISFEKSFEKASGKFQGTESFWLLCWTFIY